MEFGNGGDVWVVGFEESFTSWVFGVLCVYGFESGGFLMVETQKIAEAVCEARNIRSSLSILSGEC